MGRFSGGPLKIFHGTATPGLAEEIANHLGLRIGDCGVSRFQNGEIQVIVNESVRGDDAFVVQSTCSPPNDTLMELLILIDALRRASARRVTAVIPFYGYARQDRKTRGREPITAKLVANLLTTAHCDRVLTMDLHAGQIQGFFDIPVDHLTALPLLTDYIVGKHLEDLIVVSPDVGGVARARNMAERLGATFGVIEKRRRRPNESEVMTVIGEVKDRTAILFDDIIDTGGTIAKAAHALIENGAKAVYACATHPIFAGEAFSTLAEAPFEEIIVTNTIPVTMPPEKTEGLNVKVLSVAPLLAEAIVRIHEDLSVSKLFE
ncbi:MAG: ribose-phosphate pyrophosphokinase [Bacillota bacterium]|nr:MAG: ribose-phosphate pyrophosphokinase [Bacillota bacterium]